MKQFLRLMPIFLGLCAFNSFTLAQPWFTGPLLAPAGHTIPNGHTNLEIYGINVFADGQYNELGEKIHLPLFRSFLINPILAHGFTDWLDVQVSIPYTFNSTQGVRANRLTDISAAIGIQFLEQNNSPKRMDARILVQQVFPTGKFDQLNPAMAGADATGLGSYQTQIGLNLQYLLQVFNSHYLRTRFIVSRIYASPVTINGVSVYGGTPNTHGTIQLGIENDVDLAFELTLTQHWVAVFEGYISEGQPTRFNAINIGSMDVPTGYAHFNETALAPALEYNFNENIGVIGGVWFPVSGTNTPHYMTYMLALNAFW